MKSKVAISLIASLLLGLVFGLGIKFYYESSTFQPFIWKHPPIIINCYGKDFSESQMLRAVEYWRHYGAEIAFYEHNPPEGVCKSRWLEGMIILRKSYKLSTNTLANTSRLSSMFEMKGAVINYSPGTYNLNLLNEHELGHALGYTHVRIPGHIMHPSYHLMGANFWIP